MVSMSEEIIGNIPVTLQLNVGSERLLLYFTNSRIIVARVGKRAVGAQASFPLFAVLSAPFESLFKWRRESSKKKTAASLSPAGILVADKDNFSIPYEHIVSVEVEKTTYTTKMVLLTTQDKMSFATSLAFEKVVGLIRDRVENSKVRVKRV